jgi:hypothetical protein
VPGLAREAGLRCTRCGSADCAVRHQLRRCKRVTDHSTGKAFESVPIVRVKFCDGSTASCQPAELWRGRSTVSSVIEAVSHLERDGLAAAREWLMYGSRDDEPVSDRTLRRWQDLVHSRLIGAALGWLGPRLGVTWSEARDPAEQLDNLLEHLTPEVLVAFRALTGHSVLDTATHRARPARSSSRPVPGRLAPAPPPDPPSVVLPRGARLLRAGRDPPRR